MQQDASDTGTVGTLLKFIMLKKIVKFYYNVAFEHTNFLKNVENLPINTTEHKNCLAFLKAAGNNIYFIY